MEEKRFSPFHPTAGETADVEKAFHSRIQEKPFRENSCRVSSRESFSARRFSKVIQVNMKSFFPIALLAILAITPKSNGQSLLEMDLDATLDCHRRSYTHKVTQSDSEGRICWDMVTVMSCWGRCDSNEISDWKFPYKRSHHPVCIHGEREPKTVLLSNCEEGAEPGTEVHEYMEAVSCQCSLCKSSEANCQGVRYRGETDSFTFE